MISFAGASRLSKASSRQSLGSLLRSVRVLGPRRKRAIRSFHEELGKSRAGGTVSNERNRALAEVQRRCVACLMNVIISQQPPTCHVASGCILHWLTKRPPLQNDRGRGYRGNDVPITEEKVVPLQSSQN